MLLKLKSSIHVGTALFMSRAELNAVCFTIVIRILFFICSLNEQFYLIHPVFVPFLLFYFHSLIFYCQSPPIVNMTFQVEGRKALSRH